MAASPTGGTGRRRGVFLRQARTIMAVSRPVIIRYRCSCSVTDCPISYGGDGAVGVAWELNKAMGPLTYKVRWF
jgi:hypothetical protein